MTNPISRRSFVNLAAASAAAITIALRHVLGGPRNVPPSEKMNIAGIGIGGMGGANIANLQSENIVALCDVDHAYAAHTIRQYPRAKTYKDFRRMLQQQTDIDAVLIATPDHTHAVIAMAAMKAGKHVYCQKPLTHTVYEARMLARAAKEYKVTTQMGIQGHSMEGHRLICEWIAAGLIGEVREVDAWCSLSYYPWGHASWSCSWPGRPNETPPVPASLDWDLWIGPAAMRPYHRAYHPQTWRCFWDFGCGMMGDRGAHTLDAVVSSLKLGPPLSVEGTSCGNTPEVHPLSAIVTFRFAEREGMPPVKLTWYEGTRPPRPDDLEDGRRVPEEGGVFIKGSQGHDHGRRLWREPADHSRETDARCKAAAEDAAASQGLARAGLGPRVQDGHAGRRRLRLQRSPDRNLPAGQYRQAGGQPHCLGLGELENHQFA